VRESCKRFAVYSKEQTEQWQTFEISTPVTPSTILGSRSTICNTSVVSLETPTSFCPTDTIVNFLALVNGAAISAAT
jgi:hypothetical protein